MTGADWTSLLRRADGYRLCDPAEPSSLDQAEAELEATFPESLRDLYLVSDGIFDDPGQWFVIWPLRELVTRNIEAWASEPLPGGYLALGADGTGDPFCTARSGGNQVFHWPPIEQKAVKMAEDLPCFWSNWAAGTLPDR